MLDPVGDEAHPLYELLDTLSTLIHEYEERHYSEPVHIGGHVLQFLMEEHGLTPVDLPELGRPQAVAELLSGKRELNIQEIKILSKRFNVLPATFL